MINGIDDWAMTKLDVLDGMPTLRIATPTSRRADGPHRPADLDRLARCEPVYEEVPGWQGTVREARRFADLPAGARAYVERLEAVTGVPVGLLSVGPNRDSTLRRDA